MTNTTEKTAQQLVMKLFGGKEQLKEVKNALKAYKVTSPEMEELKQQRKELNKVIKEEKERIEQEFEKDRTYNKLREEKLDAEENIAVAKQEIKLLLSDKTREKEFLEMKLEINGSPIKLQTQLSMKLYFNGQEEK